MDACEIANFLAKELFMQQFVSLDGIQSGIPTLTTSTLTPTTLRNIEQTFIELTSDTPTHTPYQAGFVPPAPINIYGSDNLQDIDTNSVASSDASVSQSSWHTPNMNEDNSMATTDTSSVATTINANGSPTFQLVTNANGDLMSLATATTSKTSTSTKTSSKRNLGGRRPAKVSNLSEEEEAKRRVRRERNKLAAARCRKRRVDQTNDLSEKVEILQKEQHGLQKQLDDLKMVQEELQICLEAHRSHCELTNAPIAVLNTRLDSVGGRISPLDIKPIDLPHIIKSEPLDSIDSLDGPPSPKRIMITHNNPVIPSPLPLPLSLPDVSTISSSPSSSVLNTPTITTSPLPQIHLRPNSGLKIRPTTLHFPLIASSASQAIGLNGKNPIDNINGVPITTPSTGVSFNFDSLMEGGTGLTPVSGPLMPSCSSQNKHPLELTTPTSEPSKLVSL